LETSATPRTRALASSSHSRGTAVAPLSTRPMMNSQVSNLTRLRSSPVCFRVIGLFQAIHPVADEEFLLHRQQCIRLADQRANGRGHLQHHEDEDGHPDSDTAGGSALARVETRIEEAQSEVS